MIYALITLVVFAWSWFGIKTWAFVVHELTDHKGKPSVILGFFAGALWPLTYLLLTVILVSGVVLGSSLMESAVKLSRPWRGDG